MYKKEMDSEIDIFEACRLGSLPLLEKIFQRQETDIDINEKDKFGKAPLHYCCHDDKLQLLKMIFNKGGRLDLETSNGKSSLHIACQLSASAVVEYLLKKCPDLTKSAKGSHLSTHYCAKGGSVTIFERLIEAGMSPALVINNGPTCLHIACKYGNIEMVKFLLSFDDIVQVKDRFGWNALHYAVSGGNLDILKLLLTKHFDIQALTDRKYSALHISCDFNHYIIAEFITESSPSLLYHNSKEGYKPVHIVATRGNNSLFELLLSKGIAHDAVTNDGDSVLHICIQHHRTRMARSVIDKFPDLIFTKNNAGIFPIHTVVEYCNKELFDHLVCNRAIVFLRDNYNETVLHKAVKCGQISMAEHLIKHFPELVQMSDEKSNHPIHFAVSMKNSHLIEILSPFYSNRVQDQNLVELLKTSRVQEHSQNPTPDKHQKKDEINALPFVTDLLECAALCNTFENLPLMEIPDQLLSIVLSLPFPEGCTPLHISIMTNNINLCTLFSLRCPDLLSKRNSFSEAPVHTAARLGHVDLFQVLIKAGASPSLELRPGYTILHIAVNHKKLTFVEYVISNYPDIVNIAEQTKGFTPLHMCAESGELSVFKMLGGDLAFLSTITRDNKTVLDIACENDNVEIVKFILEKDAPKVHKFPMNSSFQESNETNGTLIFENIHSFVSGLTYSPDYGKMIKIAKENNCTSLLAYIQEQTSRSSNQTIYTLITIVALLCIINMLLVCLLFRQ